MSNLLESVNIHEVREKLHKSLHGTGWDLALKNFLISDDMLQILNKLLKEAIDGKRFTPKIADVFNAFKACHFDDVKVVIIGQDPYPQIDVANGVAFCCSRKMRVEKSLEYIHQSIAETVDPGYVGSPDLSSWTKQGVLLLNSALTTTISRPGAHHLLWKPFIIQVLDALIWNKPGIIYVFLGTKAQEFDAIIPSNNYKIFVSHPASASYMKMVKWDCKDMWNKINNYLKQDGREPIIW
jgi:uracil-DNA glycosylase